MFENITLKSPNIISNIVIKLLMTGLVCNLFIFGKGPFMFMEYDDTAIF